MITELKQQLFWPAEKNRQGEGGLRTKGFFKNSCDDKPLISIITVVYNGDENLEQTIVSVLDQSYDNIEYIIIDGGSKDATLDIIKKYENKIDYWVSEPDGGVYSAMNKAATLCRGEYISFLNADDWYNKNTLELVVRSLKKYDIDYLFGNTDLYDGDIFLRTSKEKLAQYKFNTPFGHQSLFVKIQYFLSEPFNTQYKVLADYNFILGLIKKELPYKYLDESIVNYRIGGLSSTANSRKEKFDICYAHFGIIRAIYSYLIVTNNYLIKPINIIIKVIRSIKKQMKIFNLLKPWVFFFYFKQFLLLLKYRGRLSLESYRLSYEKLVEVKIDPLSKINLGKTSHLCKGVNIEALDKATISIGDSFFMNKNSSVIARYGIRIGNNCMIGEHTTISDHNHKFENSNINYALQGYTGAPISIGNNVWIAGRVFIGQGVHIGDNVVIGANTIVTKSISSNSVVYSKTKLVIKKKND